MYGGKLHIRSCAHSVAPDISMSLLERKSCSARASTIFESHFHGAKVVYTIFFCAIYRSTFGSELLISESMDVIVKFCDVNIRQDNSDAIASRVLGSHRYLGTVFWCLMYRCERHVAGACPAVITSELSDLTLVISNFTIISIESLVKSYGQDADW